MAAAASPFAFFVSSVEGHVVPRYGSRTPSNIGVTRTADGWAWDTASIEGITHVEAQLYRREYARAFENKSLKLRTADEFASLLRAEEQAAKKRADDQAAAKAKAEVEANTQPAPELEPSGAAAGDTEPAADHAGDLPAGDTP
jgi:hypothetical protein